MQCKYCGTLVNEDDQFCGTCGMPVEAAPAPAPTPKKKKVAGKILTALICVAVLCAGGFGAWWFLWGPAAKVTVYVMTEIREYDENGVNTRHMKMEYNDRGMLLSSKEDSGTWQWDEEAKQFDCINDEVDGVFDIVQESDYDSQGMVVGGEYMDNEYTKYHTYYNVEYEYDSRKLIEEIIYAYTGNDDEEEQTIYFIEYDSEDRPVEIRAKQPGESTERYLELEYDSEGRVETYVNYMEGTKTRYRYEEDRLKERKIQRKDSDTSEWKTSYTVKYDYDEKDRLKEIELSDGDDYTMTIECKYSDKGKMTSVAMYRGEEKYLQMKYDYAGRKINGGEITVYDDEEVTDAQLTYDDNGNLVEMEQENGAYMRIQYKKLRLSRADAQRYYEQNELIASMSSMVGARNLGGFGLFTLPAEPALALQPFYRD